MVTEQLISYIKTQLASGYSKETIVSALLQSGYSQPDIDEAFLTLSPAQTPPSSSQSLVFTPDATPLGSNQTVPAEQNASPAKSSRFPTKHLLMFGLPLLLVLILGIGGYVYATHTPSYVLNQAYEKSKTVKSLSYDASLKAAFHLNFPLLPSSPFDASPSAPLQYSDTYSQSAIPSPTPAKKLVLTIHLTGSSDFHPPQKHAVTAEASIGDGDLNSIGGGVEVRTINQVSYIRLSKVPDFGLFDMSSLTNQWIKVDKKELEAEYPSISQTETKELSDADVKKIQEMAKKAQIVSVTKTLPSEQIAGENSYHYQLSIDKTKLKTFIKDSSTILSKVESQEFSDKTLLDLIDKVSFKNTEVWVGKKEGYTTRLLMDMTSSAPTTDGDMSFTFDITMKNINKPVSILQPVDAKNIKDIFNTLQPTYPSLYGSSSALPTTPGAYQPKSQPLYPNVLGDKTTRPTPQKQAPTMTPEQSLMFYLFQKTLGIN